MENDIIIPKKSNKVPVVATDSKEIREKKSPRLKILASALAVLVAGGGSLYLSSSLKTLR